MQFPFGRPTTIPITNTQISMQSRLPTLLPRLILLCSRWVPLVASALMSPSEQKRGWITTDFSSSSRWTIHGTISCLQRKTIILRKAITSITISFFANFRCFFFGVFRPPTSNGSFPVMRKNSRPGMISDCQALQIFLSQGTPPDQQSTTKKGAKSTLLLSFQVARRPHPHTDNYSTLSSTHHHKRGGGKYHWKKRNKEWRPLFMCILFFHVPGELFHSCSAESPRYKTPVILQGWVRSLQFEWHFFASPFSAFKWVVNRYNVIETSP